MIPFRVPSFDEMVSFFDEISRPDKRVFAMLQYLTAARPEELCRFRRGDVVLKSMKREDIWTEVIDGQECIAIRLRVLKKRKEKKYRLVCLPFANKREGYIIKQVWDWVKEQEGELFPFNRVTAWRYVTKPFREKFHVDVHIKHPLRHVRLTHLVTIYGFDAFDLTAFAGWEDIKPATSYVHKQKEMVKKLLQ